MEAEHILGPRKHSFHHGDKEIATFPAGDLMALPGSSQKTHQHETLIHNLRDQML
jgi:hypothetical protein